MVNRSSWLEINLDNIAYNTRKLKKHIGENVKLMAVVKADAYGHGSKNIIDTIIKNGADEIAVATLEEAIEIRKIYKKLAILMLSYNSSQYAKETITNDIMHTISSLENAKDFDAIAKAIGKKSLIHIKIDTGMSRMGFQVDENSVDEITEIFKLKNTIVKGVYTHFACSDEEDASFTYEQVKKFKCFIKRLEQNGVKLPDLHCSNSSAAIRFRDLNFNMVRCGLALYGSMSSEIKELNDFSLKQAMSLKCEVARVEKIKKGTTVSYGAKYKSKKDEYIATLPLGYADGLKRIISPDYKVFTSDKEFEIAGLITMDQFMIRLENKDDLKLGDVVCVFGKIGKKEKKIEELSKALGLINYEVYCNLSLRLPKLYISNQTVLDI